MFPTGHRLDFELRINTADRRTAAPVSVRVNLPPCFVQSLSAPLDVRLFAQVFQEEGMGVLDTFEPFDAQLDGAILTATLPPQVFSDRRRADATFEAVIVVASTPGPAGARARSSGPRTSHAVSDR